MDEFDDISEEELLLAAELAAHLDNTGDERSSPPQIAESIALLKNSEQWELSPKAKTQGRAEVEEWARDAGPGPITPSEAKRPPSTFRWLLWLPLPGVAVAALSLVLWRPLPESGDASRQATAPYAFESEDGAPQAEETASAQKSASADSLEHARDADGEAGFERLSPRFHAGQLRPALIQAQTAVLLQRSPGEAKEKARQAFELEMRAYRGQLIASLEAGGR